MKARIKHPNGDITTVTVEDPKEDPKADNRYKYDFYRELEQTETALTENNAILSAIDFLYRYREVLTSDTLSRLDTVAERLTEESIEVMELLEQFRHDTAVEFKQTKGETA